MFIHPNWKKINFILFNVDIYCTMSPDTQSNARFKNHVSLYVFSKMYHN